jgi:membrane protein implicated in regulation of membrane protease activity
MPALEIDVTSVFAIWMGGVIILVPLLGLTLRYGVSPFLVVLAGVRGTSGRGGSGDAGVAVRLAQLEARLEAIEADVALSRRGRAA